MHQWAGEVAGQGTFAAVLSESQAAVNVGALPVPCLAVANKTDLGDANDMLACPADGCEDECG